MNYLSLLGKLITSFISYVEKKRKVQNDINKLNTAVAVGCIFCVSWVYIFNFNCLKCTWCVKFVKICAWNGTTTPSLLSSSPWKSRKVWWQTWFDIQCNTNHSAKFQTLLQPCPVYRAQQISRSLSCFHWVTTRARVDTFIFLWYLLFCILQLRKISRLIHQQDRNVRSRLEIALNTLDSVLILPYLDTCTACVIF